MKTAIHPAARLLRPAACALLDEGLVVPEDGARVYTADTLGPILHRISGPVLVPAEGVARDAVEAEAAFYAEAALSDLLGEFGIGPEGDDE